MGQSQHLIRERMTEEPKDFLDQLHKATATLPNKEPSPHTQGSRRPELKIALKDDACEALLASIELASAAKLHDLILWESSVHEDSACVTPAAATLVAPLESSDSDVKSAAGTVTACTSSDGKLPFCSMGHASRRPREPCAFADAAGRAREKKSALSRSRS